MSGTSPNIRSILIIYWILLCYVIAALVWWYVALMNQNAEMARLNNVITKGNTNVSSLSTSDIDRIRQRKTAQYTGEGAIFLLFIMAGAVFLYRAINRQFTLNRQQQQFMMAITHELKTPIAVTRLNLETLRKHALDEEKRQRLYRNTLSEADRMNTLCNNLLLSSQMDDQAYPLTREPLCPESLVEEVVQDFSIRFPERRFACDCPARSTLHGDRFLLQMMLNNLLDNAVKYAPADRPIQVSCFSEKSEKVIQVRDEGPGIAAADKERIFEKYYRAGNDATRQSKGTGLGLYLVKRIVLAHQGRIDTTNHPEGGAVFRITLPHQTHAG